MACRSKKPADRGAGHATVHRAALAAPVAAAHLQKMSKSPRRPDASLPFMMARLAAASWGTIVHRSLMMAQGTCSAAEYQRMVSEKMAAATLSTAAFLAGSGSEAVLKPYLSRARANHRRLGRKA